MDSNFGQLPGTGLPQSSGGQGVPVGPPGVASPAGHGAMVGAPQQIQAGLPIQVADEPASDDELDQEWVNKAKDIVERTKSDPYLQSSELRKIKAEYLKARFNKDLNLGNSAPQ